MSRCRIGLLLIGIASILGAADDVLWIPKHIVSVEYPLLALQSRMNGVVKIACALQRDGTLTECKPLSGPLLLAHAAMGKLSEWRFQPIPGTTPPTSTPAVLTFEFRLSGPAVSRPRTTFVYDHPFQALIVSENLEPSRFML